MQPLRGPSKSRFIIPLQAEEAERERRASIEYRQAVARQQWEEAMDAKDEREAALQEGLPLVAQELQSVVLRGMR